MDYLRIAVLYIRILFMELEIRIVDKLLNILHNTHKEDNLVNYIRMEGNYRIFKTTTGEFVVKHKDGSSVSFITKSESSEINWCGSHE